MLVKFDWIIDVQNREIHSRKHLWCICRSEVEVTSGNRRSMTQRPAPASGIAEAGSVNVEWRRNL